MKIHCSHRRSWCK